MKNLKDSLTGLSLITSFIFILILIILDVLKFIALPDYGLIVLPFGLIVVIVVGIGDYNLKFGNIIEVKKITKEVGEIKKELLTLNAKISNINTNQNITVLTVKSEYITEIINQIKSKTTLTDSQYDIKSPSPESVETNIENP